jgi:Trk K+ transport system NAD-binding subunit
MTPGTMTAVLLAGDDGVAIRVREELEAQGADVVAICHTPDTAAARAARSAGSELIVGDPRHAETWERAGLDRARSVGLLGDDDLDNLDAALLVASETQSIPLVVRMFAGDLAHGMARLLGEHAVVLSEIELAAPALIRAALSGNTGQRVTVGGHVLEVAEVDPDDPSLVVALCNADSPTEVLPTRAAVGDLVLGLVDPSGVVRTARGALPSEIARRRLEGREPVALSHAPPLHQRAGAMLRAIPRRVWLLLGTILLVGFVSSSVFVLADHLDVLDAVYFTATTMATVGYGDVNLLDAPDWLKVFDIVLMATSAVLLASVLAFVTDALVSSRIDRALGRYPRPRRDHVIVCGLGKVGGRVLAGLHELGIPCVGVEQHPEAHGIAVAQRLEIPVVFADARTVETLEALHVSRARAVLAVTSDDLANVQCGLAAREHAPDVRVILRVFDPRLAERLDRGVELDLTRSVSALAAPAFAAALLGRPLAAPLPLSNVPLRVLDAPLPIGSPLEGRTIRDVQADGGLRILAVDGRWRPRTDLELVRGAHVSVVGTREACDALLAGDGLTPITPVS